MRKATRAIALLVLLASSALAQSRDPATADALFREARALMKKGDFASACPKLADSHRLDPAPGTAINLGDCLEKVGKLADALQAQRDALDLLSAGDKRIGPVKEQIASLEKRVPRLTIKLAPGAPTNTKVKRDDVELGEGSLGSALPVNPGEHWIVVAAPHHADTRTKVVLSVGSARSVTVAVGERDAGSDEPPSPAATNTGAARGSLTHSAPATETGSSWTQHTWGIIVGGASLGVLGVAGIFALQASSKEDDAIGKGCTATTCPNAEAQRLSDDADSARGTANVLGVLGGLGVVGGLGLVLTAPSDDAQGARVRFSPAIGRRGTRLTIGGVW